MNNPRVGVVGAGRLGSSLSARLYELGMLSFVVARSDIAVNRLAKLIDSELIIRSISQMKSLPEILLIAVNDNNIDNVADELTEAYPDALKDCIVAHCSGTLTIEAISKCSEADAQICVAHPFQTFSHGDKTAFDNAAWGLEGDDEVLANITKMIQKMGGVPHKLSQETLKRKPIYHASAVISSNYTMATLDLAREFASYASIKPEEFIPAIARKTVENFITHSPDNSPHPLTGPIARGDITAITKHIKELDNCPELKAQYCLLGLLTTERALSNGLISEDFYNQACDVFLSVIKNYYY